LLFLKRTPALKTCPGSWGLLGEHAHEDEGPADLAARALREEIGLSAPGPVLLSTNLTSGPIRYHYQHLESGGRIDDQLTWIWLVLLAAPAAEAGLVFDREVAAHAWVRPAEAQRWLARAPADFCSPELGTLLARSLAILVRCTSTLTPSRSAGLPACLSAPPPPQSPPAAV